MNRAKKPRIYVLAESSSEGICPVRYITSMEISRARIGLIAQAKAVRQKVPHAPYPNN